MHLGFVTAATSLNGSQPNFAQCLAVTSAGRLYIHIWWLLLCNGILPGAKFTLHPPSLALSYWQRYCTAVKQWARAKLCGVEHRAPPIFGRATITLVIGPHSSFDFVFSARVKRLARKSISEMSYFVSSGMQNLNQSPVLVVELVSYDLGEALLALERVSGQSHSRTSEGSCAERM